MQIRGYRILVKPKEIKRKSDGGIIISIEGMNEDRLEQSGNQMGTIVGIGHTCWQGSLEQEPWAEVGDEIIFSKHAGRFIYDPETEEQFLTINDDDVLIVTKKGN